ncbi:MAG: helix-turn-helix domain-containing protein, partial [Syntrophobacterales bacterium]
GISKAALDLLIRYDWPGNVRELMNVIEYAFVLCQEGEIMPDHLPEQLSLKPSRRSRLPQTEWQISAAGQRERIIEALAKSGSNRTRAASILGISRTTLWKRIKKYGIQLD